MWLTRVLIVTLALLLAPTACQKKVPVAATPPATPVQELPSPPLVAELPPTPVTTIPVRSTVPPPPEPPPLPPETIAIENANRAFDAGDYTNAAARFREYLLLAPEGDQSESALFHLGVLYALPELQSNWQQATTYLTELVTRHPDGPLTPMAQVILGLRSEIASLTTEGEKLDQRVRQLTTELDRLKKIETERRTR